MRVWVLLLVGVFSLASRDAYPAAPPGTDPAAEPTVQSIARRPTRAAVSSLAPPVTFLAATPVVDGILDAGLESLPMRDFSTVQKSLKDNPVTSVHYRVAYGVEFLYLFIEAAQDSATARDRGYQNGDGFHLVVCLPESADAPADQFYVLGFTPTRAPDRTWQRKFVWYRNVTGLMLKLKGTTFEWSARNGRVGYEALIPWSDLYPYHPWISPALGFNLCYVKAIDAVERNQHFVVMDERMQSEMSPRKYIRLEFEMPPAPPDAGSCPKEPRWYAVLSRNHLPPGAPLELCVASTCQKTQRYDLAYALVSEAGDTLARRWIPMRGTVDPRMERVPIDLPELSPGGYRLVVGAGHEVPIAFTVLPGFDPALLKASLEENRSVLRPGSLNTLLFHEQWIEEDLASLRAYDAASALVERISWINRAVSASESGRDLVEEEKEAGSFGIFRRGFRSKVDGTLQPYTVAFSPDSSAADSSTATSSATDSSAAASSAATSNATDSNTAPADSIARHPAFDGSHRYPLVIWLHGSGEDDRSLSPRILRLFPGCLVVAPRARGTSNIYCRDHAQEDIREAMADAMENFPVDPDRVLLAGFSMGGYGVYRTYYENPSGFRALAVLSGHPHLWYADVDFLEEARLQGFRGVDLFIFHGGLDRNCPIEKTTALVDKLKQAGANVMFIMEPEKGHEAPSPDACRAFVEWQRKIRG